MEHRRSKWRRAEQYQLGSNATKWGRAEQNRMRNLTISSSFELLAPTYNYNYNFFTTNPTRVSVGLRFHQIFHHAHVSTDNFPVSPVESCQEKRPNAPLEIDALLLLLLLITRRIFQTLRSIIGRFALRPGTGTVSATGAFSQGHLALCRIQPP